MAIGDNTDMWGRLKNLLPVGWFGDNNPIRDALLWGYANALAWGYTLYLYAKDQARIKSATDGWLDLIGLDFFGNNLVRYANQSDSSYRNRILINIFRERTTRHAMEQVLYDLTGRWPVIIEPARPADVGSYGAAVAVSRASTATYFDLNGLLATAQPNVARYDTDPISHASRLLLEDAATNLLAYSKDLMNPAWTRVGSTIVRALVLALDGGAAFKLSETAVSSVHAISRTGLTLVGNTSYCRSVLAKADGSGRFLYLETDGFSNWTVTGAVRYDLDNGVIVSATAGLPGYGIQAVGSGWYLCWLASTTISSPTSASMDVQLATSGPTYLGDGSSGAYISDPQLEVGIVPTSRIFTGSTSATRAADILLNNMPAGSVAICGYGVAGAYGSVLLPYQAFITAFRPTGQGLPFISGYGVSTGAYSTPSRSAYGKLSGGDVTDADIYAAVDATKPVGTVAWTRISS